MNKTGYNSQKRERVENLWDIREEGAVQCRHMNARRLYDQTNITMEMLAQSGDPRDVATWRHDADACIDAASKQLK